MIPMDFQTESATSRLTPELRCAILPAGGSGSPFTFEHVDFPNTSFTDSSTSPASEGRSPELESPALSGSANQSLISYEEVANSIHVHLARHGVVCDRRSNTTDGSVLLQYLSGRKACVDVYPTGEIIVIVKQDGINNVFELDVSDLPQILNLVRDGL
jgi:hypothetical protein